jgi:hypothetical protein
MPEPRSDTDPRERERHSEKNAQERWEEMGNPPSQETSKPLAFAGWAFYVVIGVVVALAVIFLIVFHGG